MPITGNLSLFTCSVFRLDPTATAPIEPIIDLVPGLTPLRVTFDLIDNESVTYEYDTTEHAIQGFTDITSHVRKRLEQVSITGTMGALPPIIAAHPAVPVPGGIAPLEKIRFQHLKQIADAKAPVMISTPRITLPKAIITSLQSNWTPKDGESLVVSITCRELRLVSAVTGEHLAPDFPAQTPGNNATTGGGQTSATPVNQTATPSATPGVAPTVGGV